MADSFLPYQNPTTTDKKLDSESLTVGSNTVERERVQIAGAAATDIAEVSNQAQQMTGDEAHDAADAGNPVKVGGKAIAHGSNPSAVAAADRTNWLFNRAGVPFVIGGHPNIQTIEYLWTTAQTDDAIVTVSTGSKIVVTRISVTLDEATTVGVGFRIGFGTSTLPTLATDGIAVAGILLSHPGMVPGGGITVGDGSGILGVGADDEDLRITTDVATGGAGRAYISYYTIDS